MTSRSANFTSEEINLLLDIVEQYKDIIENKKSDCISTREKNDTWKEIVETFNGRNGGQFRSLKVLRTKYYNLRKETNKRVAAQKRSMFGTGGGPPAKIALNSTDDRIVKILGEKRIMGFESSYDSDFLRNEEVENGDVIGKYYRSFLFGYIKFRRSINRIFGRRTRRVLFKQHQCRSRRRKHPTGG